MADGGGYDFAPLTARMGPREVARRRREMLAGRSAFTAMDIEHWVLLILSAFPWFVSAFFVVALWMMFASVPQSPGEFVLLLALAIGATVVGFGGSFLLSWWCVHPPRWRPWARMHRFAEANGLEFIRMREGVELPGSLVAPKPRTPRIFDSFRDPRTRLELGNWVRPSIGGRRLADWRAYVVLDAPPRDTEPDEGAMRRLVRRAAVHAGVDWGLDFRAEFAGSRLVAVRFPSVRMRRTGTIRAMFALADGFRRAMLEVDTEPVGPALPWTDARD